MRSGPSGAVLIGETPYLVDFGPGVVRRAAAAHEAGIDALEVSRLTRAFVTHLHSDHTAGYADLVLTPWVLGREAPLRVYGPPGLRAMTEHLVAAYAEDIRERIEGLEPANPSGHRVEVFEIEPGRVYADAHVVVDAFAVNHGSWPAFGYRFTAADRTIVISGDTAPFPGWEKAYRDCDVLIHEVQSTVGLTNRDPAWRAYHGAVHTSTRQVAEIANLARPKLLVLTHVLLHGDPEEALLQEMRSLYAGDVVFGNDLDVL
jgi:ribonuclease BN (tRNA processing enzyme)